MLIAIAAYLAAHFAAYALILRHRASLRTEKGILLYHLGSAVFVGLAGLGVAIIEPAEFGVPGLVLLLSAHGIYSLSFLELWSLAEGGYSLYIIRSIARAEAAGSEPDFAREEQIGGQKQRDRLAHLKELGLVAIRDGVIRLTVRGRIVATILLFFVRWSNAKRSVSAP
jgi:hypothetical protein